ncbi:MAG TPA: hypothetical protein VLI05_05740 [Candidatus Saccharimonadia bacterium]|nr:hypothetical protein [Candidatus Saccharimonadia bacterium]
MGLYDFLWATYNEFLVFFPADVRWLVSLALLGAIIMICIGLIRRSVVFVLVPILLLPIIAPVAEHVWIDLEGFLIYILYLLHIAPATWHVPPTP